MAKYAVKEEFELNGSKNEVGAEVELSESEAAELGAKVELVPENAGEGEADKEASDDGEKGEGENAGGAEGEKAGE